MAKIKYDDVKDIAGSASLDESKKKKPSFNPDGAPRKDEADKLTKSVVVKFTAAQKEKLVKVSLERGIGINAMIRNALIDNGIL